MSRGSVEDVVVEAQAEVVHPCDFRWAKSQRWTARELLEVLEVLGYVGMFKLFSNSSTFQTPNLGASQQFFFMLAAWELVLPRGRSSPNVWRKLSSVHQVISSLREWRRDSKGNISRIGTDRMYDAWAHVWVHAWAHVWVRVWVHVKL